MPRYKLTIEYDGTGLAGWQRQNDQPSVQQHLEEAVFNFSGERVTIVAAGRTDAGVHATGQVVHLDLAAPHTAFRVMSAVNFHLIPHRISVVDAGETDEHFHARFSATARHYVYRIRNRRSRLALDEERMWHVPAALDIPAMQEAAKLLVGTHDFSSFRASICQAKSPVKTLERFEIEPSGDEIRIYGSARSFLHHQMRNMVGSLVMVGKGSWTPENIRHALEAKDRTAGGPTAPPHGLYLLRVDY